MVPKSLPSSASFIRPNQDFKKTHKQERNLSLSINHMMAFYFSLLIVLLFTTISSAATPTSSPASPPSTTTPIPPPPPLPLLNNLQNQQQQQLINNIIDALIGTGDFGTWASILSAIANPLLPPNTTKTTLFIPGDEALSHLPTTPPMSFDPFIFPYHIVPQHRLSFSDLVNLRLKTRLPTLLPNKSILITNNSLSNFTLDDSRITHPDLYITDAVIVHGIRGILDYAVYGDGLVVSNSLPDSSPEVEAVTSSSLSRSPPPPPPRPSPPPTTTMVGQGRSEVLCLMCTRFAIVVSVVCAVLLFL